MVHQENGTPLLTLSVLYCLESRISSTCGKRGLLEETSNGPIRTGAT